MAQAPKTVFTYPLNGTQRDFPIAFEYLARKFVRVTLLGANARKELVLNTDYRFTTKVQITTTQAWGTAEGYDTIEIRRYTSAEERLVDFNDGSILRAFDLNLSQIQTLHVAEEARDLTADTISVNQDGNLDARGRKIINLSNGVNNTDAVNVGQLRQFDTSTGSNADRAEAAKNRAVQAETNTARDSASAAVNATKAVSSAGTAVQAASDANRSYEKIVPLEQSTVTNATKAEQQAGIATSAADSVLAIKDNVGAVPVGTVAMFTTSSVPAGWLVLDGSTFDVSAYPTLATIFPSGRLPDWRDRYPKGAGTETLLGQFKAWQHYMPPHGHNFSFTTSEDGAHYHDRGTMNITGQISGLTAESMSASGAFRNSTKTSAGRAAGSGAGDATIDFNASLGNWTGYTNTTGNHRHSGSGTTEVNSSGTRIETDRVGVTFAIKAAGGATSEDLINVSKYEERLRVLENNNRTYFKTFNNVKNWIAPNKLRVLLLEECRLMIPAGDYNSYIFDVHIYYDNKNVGIWRQHYTLTLCGLEFTDDNTAYEYTHSFTAHTAANRGVIMKQSGASNVGTMGYLEVWWPSGINPQSSDSNGATVHIKATRMY